MNLTDAPQVLVFAGPNGSGKSSVTSAWQAVGLYINADDIKTRRGSTDLQAAQEAEQLRELCLDERRSFTFETVLSTDRGTQIRPNRFWTAETIEKLTGGERGYK